MPDTFRSSGDLLADRRYAYAKGAFDDGDHAAAADLAAQAIELVPGFAPAHALLGRARAALGARGEAVAALKHALELEPGDALGVRIDLARLDALEPAEAISDGYVRALFDDYASGFDRHLVKKLGYRGPEMLAEALERAALKRFRPFAFDAVLDLGCGTGLMGQALAGRFRRMEGVDLSPRMLVQAEKTRLYERLHERELVAFLEERAGGEADLIVAADVFVYLAALDRAFGAAHRVLERGGFLAFTVQAPGDQGSNGFELGEDARYAHGEAYLRRLADETGFAPVLVESVSTRHDRGVPVPGFLVVLER
jgi:predicted TPR repeat methyltransferase